MDLRKVVNGMFRTPYFIVALCDPAITTVSQPGYQLGFVAGELLMEKIANPEAPPSQILLDTELIIRDSL